MDPLSVHRFRWLLSIGLVLGSCTLLYLFVDREVATAARELPLAVRQVFGRIASLGNSAWILGPGIPACLLLHRGTRPGGFLAHRDTWRRWRRRLDYLVGCVACSGLAAVVIKIFCGRPRPKMFFGHDQYAFSFFQFSARMWSFPSGHTTTIFAAMTGCFFLAPRRWYLWFPLAVLVAAGRVVTGAHFPSDVLAGAFLGTATSILLRDYFRRRHWLDFPGCRPGQTPKRST